MNRKLEVLLPKEVSIQSYVKQRFSELCRRQLAKPTQTKRLIADGISQMNAVALEVLSVWQIFFEQNLLVFQTANWNDKNAIFSPITILSPSYDNLEIWQSHPALFFGFVIFFYKALNFDQMFRPIINFAIS